MSEYKVIFKTVGLISLLGLIFAISLSIVFENSYPIIEKNKSDFKKKLLDQILLGVDYNNNILESFIEIEANELLKNKHSSKAYIAKKDGQLKAVLIDSIEVSDNFAKSSGVGATLKSLLVTLLT